ncbi:MAG TPA: YbhB/YbcL family Raf kinase inhibitor-like protein [Allosphingosinicella sp.]|nr:YbhB/YbcL family Raf kinase inhibitor-like protein [Allosphingosinicella sp.]
MKTRILLACLLAVACSEQGDAAKPGGLAVERVETQTAGTLTLTSRDFAAGGNIPPRFSAYDIGISPRLSWRGLPEGTKRLALIMEDPDASGAQPFVHWVAWNIDPAAGGLPSGSVTPGARIGRNGRGNPGYFGPHPGKSAHHYHFQMFALDSELSLKPGSSREQLIQAMKGHVLGKADLVGLFAKP